jgi:hypothetical protein
MTPLSTDDRLERVENLIKELIRSYLEENQQTRTELVRMRVSMGDLNRLLTTFVETRKP